jgi:hypothetical protein
MGVARGIGIAVENEHVSRRDFNTEHLCGLRAFTVRL